MGGRNEYPLYPMIIEADQTAWDIADRYIRILDEISRKLGIKILGGDIVKEHIYLPREKYDELKRKCE